MKVERIKKFINPSRHFVDHSQDVSKGDTFISINGGCSYLSKKQSDDLNYVLILDSTEKIETKYIDISDQKNNYVTKVKGFILMKFYISLKLINYDSCTVKALAIKLYSIHWYFCSPHLLYSRAKKKKSQLLARITKTPLKK